MRGDVRRRGRGQRRGAPRGMQASGYRDSILTPRRARAGRRTGGRRRTPWTQTAAERRRGKWGDAGMSLRAGLACSIDRAHSPEHGPASASAATQRLAPCSARSRARARAAQGGRIRGCRLS
jgi:hypothetical protein